MRPCATADAGAAHCFAARYGIFAGLARAPRPPGSPQRARALGAPRGRAGRAERRAKQVEFNYSSLNYRARRSEFASIQGAEKDPLEMATRKGKFCLEASSRGHGPPGARPAVFQEFSAGGGPVGGDAAPGQAVPGRRSPPSPPPTSVSWAGKAGSCCSARATRARAARLTATRQVVSKSSRPSVHTDYTRARKEARCRALMCRSTQPRRPGAPQRPAAEQLECTTPNVDAQAGFRSSSPVGRAVQHVCVRRTAQRAVR